MLTDKEYKHFATFEAMSAAWLESSFYAEESYLKIVSDDLEGKPRQYRKQYLKQAKKSFKDMQSIMKRMIKVIEIDNEEFYDESIDKIHDVAKSIDFNKMYKK